MAHIPKFGYRARHGHEKERIDPARDFIEQAAVLLVRQTFLRHHDGRETDKNPRCEDIQPTAAGTLLISGAILITQNQEQSSHDMEIHPGCQDGMRRAQDLDVQPIRVVPPVVERRTGQHRHRARDLLGDSAPLRPAAPRAVASRQRPVAQTPAVAQACALLLVPTGHTLFIDQAPAQGRERRVLDLLAALAIAIGGEQVAVLPCPFAWPPQGVGYDPAQARDAVFGMLAKLRESTRFDQVIVMGEYTAALLLGWDGTQYRAREPRSLRITGIDAPLLVTHSTAELLENPLLKRVVWSEIHAGSQRDA